MSKNVIKDGGIVFTRYDIKRARFEWNTIKKSFGGKTRLSFGQVFSEWRKEEGSFDGFLDVLESSGTITLSEDDDGITYCEEVEGNAKDDVRLSESIIWKYACGVEGILTCVCGTRPENSLCEFGADEYNEIKCPNCQRMVRQAVGNLNASAVHVWNNMMHGKFEPVKTCSDVKEEEAFDVEFRLTAQAMLDAANAAIEAFENREPMAARMQNHLVGIASRDFARMLQTALEKGYMSERQEQNDVQRGLDALDKDVPF